MTEIEPSGQEPDASTRNQPTTDTGREAVETVKTAHIVSDWRLSVRGDGSVEAHKMGATRVAPYTTRDGWWRAEGERFRCGKTIEDVLGRYAHETRFDRDPNTEHGAALRRKIIDALCATATDADCGHSECDGDAAYVVHTNAPTGPSTALVCDDHATAGTYATLHALENVHEQEVEDQ